ncbi:MAG TPA: diacylglycerol kinase family protein [Acidimicrobiales bacterium]|nr:diacylglycerol kinase family protein [Acidimicrobiales bacterium]
MRVGRFTRRAGLRAGLSAGAASPLGREAAAVAAAVGAAQEKPLVGATLGTGAAALVVHCWRSAGHRSLRYPIGRRDACLVAARVAAGAAIGVGTRFVWSVAPKEPAAVAPHRTWRGLDPAPDGAGIGIVVNPGAGSGRAGTLDPAAELASGLPRAEIVVPDDPSEIPDQLRKLAASGVRALGIAGGDGSINTAAGIAIENHLPLVVVPAGTLNHLARDLGVETVDDAVDAVRAGHAIEIDVARIAGRPFLNTASFGSYVDIVDAREDLERQIGKWPALLVALVRVLRHGTPVDVVVDREPHRLWIVFVGNCRYEPDGMAPTWRERLDDGQLDVRVADAAAPLARLRLVAAVLTGRISRSPVFRTWCTTNMHVESTDGPLRLARDGETFDGPGAFDIGKNGDRLAVYTPNRELA